MICTLDAQNPMADSKQKTIKAALVWINAVLAFLTAFGVVLGIALLLCALILGTEERSGILASTLAIAILLACIVTGVFAVIKAKLLLTSRSLKTNVIVFLVLLALFIMIGPGPMTYSSF
jgi:hypothetical protein